MSPSSTYCAHLKYGIVSLSLTGRDSPVVFYG